jgi:type IV pilus assembly protein PilQ
LREAPAIEVLTVIGRIAGLSVVSADSATATTGTTTADGGLKKPVSLDIENEPVQDVFNNVLRITGLDANRIGNTIFVATKLPVTLKNLVTKTYRLNQITAGEASAYLIGLGASRVVNRQRLIPGVATATIGTAAATTTAVTTETIPTLEIVTITEASGATPLLKGVQVIAEERGNSVTLVGSPRQIEFAEAQLARLDLRKRQVTVNVRVVEVSLTNTQTTAGALDFAADGNPDIQGASTTIGIGFDSGKALSLPTSFLASLAAGTVNGNAKILTDPTLTVQEGETATIALTNSILVSVKSTASAVAGGQPTTEGIFKDVGLTLAIQIDRIDDNGFINLSVSPTISSATLGPSITSSPGVVNPTTLTSTRTLNSGKIRLRDAQTLVLSGIIQDSESESVSKVPILGDLPIIGALFRSTTSTNNRSEVIIIVTPKIIDDSQDATWGYTYQPGAETQKVIDSNQRKIQ